MVIPEARLKFFRRARALGALCASSGAPPSRVISAVLTRWQDLRYPTVRSVRRRPYGTSVLARAPAVVSFGDWLASVNDFNVAAYWLSSAYAICLGDAERARRSLFFTPPRLAERVIDGLLGEGAGLGDGVWHDPACGGAAFLVPVAQRMANYHVAGGLRPEEALERIQGSVSGCDLDPALVTLSIEFLKMALSDALGGCASEATFAIDCADGLTSSPRVAVPRVVICNPPYRKLTASQASAYSDDFSNVIEGQPNVYGLFIAKCLQIAKEGGLVGLLTPTSFLSGQYFSKLRAVLLQQTEPRRIEIVSGRKSTFIDVEQETAITVLSVADKVARTTQRIASVAVRSDGGEFEDVGACILPGGGSPWPIPRRIGDIEILRSAEQAEARLASYGYRVRVGHLVDYRDSRPRQMSSAQSSQRGQVYPIVWATDIDQGGGFLHGRRRARGNRALYVDVGAESGPGVVREAAIVMQRVTSTEQPRRLVCAAVPEHWLKRHGGFVAENHVLVIAPAGDEIPLIDRSTLAAILGSKTVDRIFRSMSGVANVSVYELSHLPLPDPQVVLRELRLGRDIELAVQTGYGLCVPKHLAA